MIRFLPVLIFLLLIAYVLVLRWDLHRPVKPQPGRTVNRAPEHPALEAPTPPLGEFLKTWDLYLKQSSHEAVLEKLRLRGLDHIAEQFDAAHRPCPRVETGIHDFVDHTVELLRFSEPHGRIIHNWRCRLCGAATADADLIGQPHFQYHG